MKKIVPFNKVLKFSNEVSEINSISLEHNISLLGDSISGEFIISGEYTSKDNILDNEEFKFNLPFDIALGVNYNKDNMVVDIDDFRYELIIPDKLNVDIDLYIDGEEVPIENDSRTMMEDDDSLLEDIIENNNEENELDNDIDININNTNINNNENINDNVNNDMDNNVPNNIFSPFLDEETYATYRVYTVMEGDTIDSILEKYNVSMDNIMKYNDISNLKPMDKLIIPSDEK